MAGLYVTMINDFESRIRGGHSFVQLRIGDRPVSGPARQNHLIVGLDDQTVPRHAATLAPDGLVLVADEAPAADQRHTTHRVDFQTAGQKGGKQNHGQHRRGRCLSVAAGGAFGSFRKVLQTTFESLDAKKREQNAVAARYGYEAVAEVTFSPAWQWRIDPPRGRLIDGAQAVAFGALAGDCRFCAFYPMSPATGIVQALIDWGGDLPLVVEQAEDEIAAVNMVIGAAFAGVRAMTATSGGGFALMAEGLGLAAITETPVVIVDAQRPGPATGLPTRTAQADLQFVIHAAQDEFPRFVFAPGTPHEAYGVTQRALDLSHRFQVPSIILVDQFLADTLFVAEEAFVVPASVQSHTVGDNEIDDPGAYRRFALTESGISPRALPCRGRALVKVCSDEHDEEGHITEDAHMRDAMVQKRAAKVDLMRREIRPPDTLHDEADTLLVCWGSMKGVLYEAVARLRAAGYSCGGVHYVDLWPFPDRRTADILSQARRFFIVEQNHTAQLGQIIRQQTGLQHAGAVLKTNGRPMRADEITTFVEKALQGDDR
jgi:2-oxoglutarate ferredoxin oxidoreductase subunit alpha